LTSELADNRADRERLVGVSLKMYFGSQETLDWCARIGAIADGHPAVASGMVHVFVLPTFPLLMPVIALLRDTAVEVGAQNLCSRDSGPFTGEVSGQVLAELGCAYVAVGHAERRRLFGETDDEVALKVEAALRNDLCPVVCVGEADPTDGESAARECVRQLRSALSRIDHDRMRARVVVAYEPRWAIGADRPAPDQHIAEVCSALQTSVRDARPAAADRVIYGGSAGPGLLERLGDSVDGLFLGRYAHDPVAFEAVLDEVGRITRHEAGN
jgi:triosephosphate isomerase